MFRIETPILPSETVPTWAFLVVDPYCGKKKSSMRKLLNGSTVPYRATESGDGVFLRNPDCIHLKGRLARRFIGACFPPKTWLMKESITNGQFGSEYRKDAKMMGGAQN